ncbi:hypothetical protein [Streptomyces californicus]|uniref:hypothetical protein n=1 Tax=Streptomyces californicus TaxID=67351 RepID=UPI003790BA55
MVDGAHREGQDRRNAALVEAFRVLAAVREQLLAAVKEQLNGQGPDAGAPLGSVGSLVADCQALLDDLAPSGADADVGVPRPRA